MLVFSCTPTSFFKQKEAVTLIRQFQKHDVDVVLGIPNAEKNGGWCVTKHILFVMYRTSLQHILCSMEDNMSLQFSAEVLKTNMEVTAENSKEKVKKPIKIISFVIFLQVSIAFYQVCFTARLIQKLINVQICFHIYSGKQYLIISHLV